MSDAGYLSKRWHVSCRACSREENVSSDGSRKKIEAHLAEWGWTKADDGRWLCEDCKPHPEPKPDAVMEALREHARLRDETEYPLTPAEARAVLEATR